MATTPNIEDYVPVVKYNGLNSVKDVDFSGATNCALPASTTVGGSSIAGLGNITSSSASAVAQSITNTNVAFTGTSGIFEVIGNGITTGTGVLVTSAGVIATTGNLVSLVASGLTTGTALNFGTLVALTTGIGIKMAHTTSVIADGGSLIQISSSSADTGGTTNGTQLDVLSSGQTTGTVCKIRGTSASATATKLLDIVQSGVSTGFTGNIVGITSASTTGAGTSLLITNVNTTAGNALKIVSNALTLGAGTGILVSHTTSVLGAGTSLVRISSTGIDTGTTTGVLLDLSTTSAVGSTQILLTDSSADTAARIGFLSSVTNTAAVLAVPFKSSNVAVNNSKFTKHFVMTDGTKTLTIWISQDATSPNTVLSGTAGDICLNGTSNRMFYCTGTTNWTASNA